MQDKQLKLDQIASIFSLYGYEAPVRTPDGPGSILSLHPRAVVVYLNTIAPGQCMVGHRREGAGDFHYTYLYKDALVKLLLTPLKKISDEHARLVAKHLGLHYALDENNILWAKHWLLEGSRNYNVRTGDAFLIFQFLAKQGYAVPLYFDLDCPYNGMDALELGWAEDASISEPLKSTDTDEPQSN